MNSSWVWVLTFTTLGSNPEHGQIAKFETRQDCQRALALKRQEAEQRGRELVGTCYFTRQSSRS